MAPLKYKYVTCVMFRLFFLFYIPSLPKFGKNLMDLDFQTMCINECILNIGYSLFEHFPFAGKNQIFMDGNNDSKINAFHQDLRSY